MRNARIFVDMLLSLPFVVIGFLVGFAQSGYLVGREIQIEYEMWLFKEGEEDVKKD